MEVNGFLLLWAIHYWRKKYRDYRTQQQERHEDIMAALKFKDEKSFQEWLTKSHATVVYEESMIDEPEKKGVVSLPKTVVSLPKTKVVRSSKTTMARSYFPFEIVTLILVALAVTFIVTAFLFPW